MNITGSRYCLYLLGSILITVNTPIAVKAENTNWRPKSSFPLNVTNNSNIYLSRNNFEANDQDSPREYTFKAPESKSFREVEQSNQAQGYKVEVYGSAEDLLKQVRGIEPRAFIKGDIIQVGIFSQQDNAEDLVRKLTIAGFWSRIMPE